MKTTPCKCTYEDYYCDSDYLRRQVCKGYWVTRFYAVYFAKEFCAFTAFSGFKFCGYTVLNKKALKGLKFLTK